MQPKILVIDDQYGRADDPMFPERFGNLPFRWVLESAEESRQKFSAKKALNRIREEKPNVVLLDIMFGEQRRLGVEILENVREEFPTLPVVVFTTVKSKEDIELVVRCMELGANEYLEKPADKDTSRMQAVLTAYTDGKSDRAIYGNSSAVRALRADIARVALSGQANVLIYGETGSGKELVARAIHRQGPRKEGPFEPYNCAEPPLETLESDLFGHERGAFTDAKERRIGLLESSNTGVLFLDEVASMPLQLQKKLLRAEQERCFRRMGGRGLIQSDFQLVCATNKPPADLVKSGTLREDFFYRIATISLRLPPLRERREDVPMLAVRFLRKCKEHPRYAIHPGERLSDDSLLRMQLYDWPGNVRELEHAIQEALVLSRGKVIEIKEFNLVTGVPEQQVAAKNALILPANSATWERKRLLAEIQLGIQGKRHVQSYKGGQWKAEFMRLMYPECKAANAKGFDDLIKRLTQGPWGSPKIRDDVEIKRLLDELTAR